MFSSYAKYDCNVDILSVNLGIILQFRPSCGRRIARERAISHPFGWKTTLLVRMIIRCWRTALCCLVEYLAYSVDRVSNGSAFLLLIVNQVDRIKQFQVINLTLYVQQLLPAPYRTFRLWAKITNNSDTRKRFWKINAVCPINQGISRLFEPFSHFAFFFPKSAVIWDFSPKPLQR